jgi:hypothetical protein
MGRNQFLLGSRKSNRRTGAEKVYGPDIKAKWDQLYKKPEYNPLEM